MKYIILILVLVLLGGVLLIYKSGLWRGGYRQATVVVDNNNFKVDVADTPIKLAKGLAGRKHIEADKGMLFVFGSPSTKTFWMKDMFVPIDILWINEGKVVGIENGVQPESSKSLMRLRRYRSPGPVQNVLEIAAGRASELGIAVGSEVIIRFE